MPDIGVAHYVKHGLTIEESWDEVRFLSSTIVAWKGASRDDRLWYSSIDVKNWAPNQARWAEPSAIPGAASSAGPSLSRGPSLPERRRERIYSAWRGSGDDEQLWYSSFENWGGAAKEWAAPSLIPGAASSAGPSLADHMGKLYAAWRGSGDDEQLWYSSFDGSGWALPSLILGASSSAGPWLAIFSGVLYAAWRGSGDDDRLWYSSLKATDSAPGELGWSPPSLIPGAGSSTGPSLQMNVDWHLYAAWKGSDDDRLWYSSFDGSGWALPSLILGATSSTGPSLFSPGLCIAAVWRSSGDDGQLWYSVFTRPNWTPQEAIPGALSGPLRGRAD